MLTANTYKRETSAHRVNCLWQVVKLSETKNKVIMLSDTGTDKLWYCCLYYCSGYRMKIWKEGAFKGYNVHWIQGVSSQVFTVINFIELKGTGSRFSPCSFIKMLFFCRDMLYCLSKQYDHVMMLSKNQSRRKRADLFLVCYRSVETSAADLQIVYRSPTDYLRIVCRMSAEYLQNVCRMSAEMICNLCRRSADEGGINSKNNIRCTAPIKHLLFLL